MMIRSEYMRDSGLGQLWHWCPGCKEMHAFYVTHPGSSRLCNWDFNFDYEKPTANPSIKHTFRREDGEKVCHYFLRDGNIHFCSDCSHSLSGQVVPLPRWPSDDSDCG